MTDASGDLDVANGGAPAVRSSLGRVSSGRQTRRRIDRAITFALAGSACTVLAIAGTILAFISRAGIQGFMQSGVFGMLFGRHWSPDATTPRFGFFPYIATTVASAIFAVVLGAAPAVLAAVYLSEFASARIRSAFRRVMEVAAALPSVVFGFIALTYLVPLFANPRTGCQGLGLAPATVLLAVMIAPTVSLLSLDVLARTAPELRDASAALGASRWQTTWRAVFPTAWRGILVAVFFGFARAAGETMAVQMVAGNGLFAPFRALRPTGARVLADACPSFLGFEPFRPTSTLATRIVTDMPNTQPGTPWNNALFSMSLVLLFLSTAVVITTRWLGRRAAS
jgi:phosphate transport system permease protein